DWDYLFAEVSTDDGATYTSLKGYEVGTDEELTTPDDYSDPNGNLSRFGGEGAFAYTGSSGDWIRAYNDLSDYAGQQIRFRFRYMTDEAFMETGVFLDNFLIRSSTTTILNDPVENDNANGWTTVRSSSNTPPTTGAG
ncbi:immune inhibitor A, partial [Streptomyces rochei]